MGIVEALRDWCPGCLPCRPAVDGGLAEREEPAEVVGSEALGGKDRYLAHVSTDKPVYRSGEKVLRPRRDPSTQPITRRSAARIPAVVQILGPKGETVVTATGRDGDRASPASPGTVPDGQAGGEYVLQRQLPGPGFAPGRAEVRHPAPTARRGMKTQIRFLRDGYGPGRPGGRPRWKPIGPRGACRHGPA